VNTSYLPSKKVWVLIGIVLVIAGSFFIFSGDENNPSFTTQISDRITSNDIENDGYLGSGINSQDSNALEQVGFPRNKTVDAWEHLLPYMASYVSVEDEGKEITTEELNRIAQEVAENIATDKIEFYTRSDLQINSEADFEDLDNYFANLTETTVRHYTESNMEDELLIFAQASADNQVTSDELSELQDIADAYRSLADQLINISVPDSLADTHLSVVNNYLGLGLATRNMAAIENDPVRSMLGIENYHELIEEQAEINEQLGDQIGQQARILLESQ